MSRLISFEKGLRGGSGEGRAGRHWSRHCCLWHVKHTVCRRTPHTAEHTVIQFWMFCLDLESEAQLSGGRFPGWSVEFEKFGNISDLLSSSHLDSRMMLKKVRFKVGKPASLHVTVVAHVFCTTPTMEREVSVEILFSFKLRNCYTHRSCLNFLFHLIQYNNMLSFPSIFLLPCSLHRTQKTSIHLQPVSASYIFPQ